MPPMGVVVQTVKYAGHRLRVTFASMTGGELSFSVNTGTGILLYSDANTKPGIRLKAKPVGLGTVFEV